MSALRTMPSAISSAKEYPCPFGQGVFLENINSEAINENKENPFADRVLGFLPEYGCLQ